MHQSVGKGGTSARGDDNRKGDTVDTLVHSADIGTVLEKGIDRKAEPTLAMPDLD